jgi:hypothetical protein
MRFAALLGSLACLLVFSPGAQAAEPLLPDLTQETPFDLGIVTDGKRYHLGFGSVVYNYGDGPLRIVGSRDSPSDPTMTATQVIDQDDGSKVSRRGIGTLRYVDSITHRHWHYLKFDTYSLRRPDGRLVRPDQKTGFCLGDRLRAPDRGPLPAMQPFLEYGGNCGYDEPDRLEVQEGIAVGYGDDYGPQVEGQFVNITRVPAGRYVLVHRVNADGALQEKTLENNAASVLIDVRYRRGVPRVTQVARCPGSGTCPVAPALTQRRAVSFARLAFRRSFRSSASGVACGEPIDGVGTCTGTLPDGRAVIVEVRYSVARGRLFWTYAARAEDGGSTRRGRVSVSLGRARRVPLERQSAIAPWVARRSAGSRSKAAGPLGYCPVIGRG